MALLKKGSHHQGIRRRWMVNSIGTVSFVLLVALIAFSLFVGGYYYNSIRHNFYNSCCWFYNNIYISHS